MKISIKLIDRKSVSVEPIPSGVWVKVMHTNGLGETRMDSLFMTQDQAEVFIFSIEQALEVINKRHHREELETMLNWGDNKC